MSVAEEYKLKRRKVFLLEELRAIILSIHVDA
jgi:hypothetical protein